MFHGERWTVSYDPHHLKVPERFGLRTVDGEDGDGLGKKRIRYGGTSGYQAVNLAYLWGARRILLLGYDYHTTERSHFFGDHPGILNAKTNYGQFVPPFKQLAADLKAEGVEVINCTRMTALRCFQRATMDDLA